MQRIYYVILTCITILICVNARRFETRCKLVRELNRVGIPNDLFLGSCELIVFITVIYIVCCGCVKCIYKIDNIFVSFTHKVYVLFSDNKTGVCLIEKVSNRDTSAFTEKSGGRKFYGLYQIPNKWCKVGKPGGDCNIACELLLDDDIRDDTACAVNIFDKEGFKYWSLWTTRCKSPDVNHITTEIYKCPEFMGFSSSPERDRINDTRESRRLS